MYRVRQPWPCQLLPVMQIQEQRSGFFSCFVLFLKTFLTRHLCTLLKLGRFHWSKVRWSDFAAVLLHMVKVLWAELNDVENLQELVRMHCNVVACGLFFYILFLLCVCVCVCVCVKSEYIPNIPDWSKYFLNILLVLYLLLLMKDTFRFKTTLSLTILEENKRTNRKWFQLIFG